MNLGPDQVDLISPRVSWAVRSLPMKYLCVPLHFSKLKVGKKQPVVDKIIELPKWASAIL